MQSILRGRIKFLVISEQPENSEFTSIDCVNAILDLGVAADSIQTWVNIGKKMETIELLKNWQGQFEKFDFFIILPGGAETLAQISYMINARIISDGAKHFYFLGDSWRNVIEKMFETNVFESTDRVFITTSSKIDEFAKSVKERFVS